METGAGPTAPSDRLLDSFCLIGPVSRCRERRAAYRRRVWPADPCPGFGPAAALNVIRASERAPESSRTEAERPSM
jgi:hypothetical protein